MMRNPKQEQGGRRILAVLTAALAGACAARAPQPEPLRAVRSTVVSPAPQDRVRSFSGSTRARQEAKLSFRVAGTLVGLPVRVGQSVTAGQTIGRLEDTDFRLRVSQAEASVSQAEAAARNARAQRERAERLYENENLSQGELDGAIALDESSRAQLRAARDQLGLATQQLRYTVLVAPVTGAIASVHAEENENLSPGTVVAVLTSGSRLEVEVAVPESLIAEVEVGRGVSVVVPAVPETSTSPLRATVTEVGLSSTRTATTYPVVVRLEESPPSILPGMAAEVRFLFPRKGSANLVVPYVAVSEDRDGTFVMVLEADGEAFRVRRRAVTVGDAVAEGLEISSGLEVGERIVVAGVRRLEDGRRVRLLTETST